MDLLIEIVVWLMRSLFGDPEKPADPSKFPAQRQAREKRGPYVYGDEPVATGKSLEEILEEVRREALQRRTGRAPEPEPEQAAVPEPRRRTLAENMEAADEALEENVYSERRPGHGIDVQALPSEIRQAHAERKQPAMPVKAAQADVGPSAIIAIESQQGGSASITAIAERQSNVGLRVRERDKDAATHAAGSSLHLLYALRHAPPAEKARVAREALVIFEVFGQPRARRRHKVGARII